MYNFADHHIIPYHAIPCHSRRCNTANLIQCSALHSNRLVLEVLKTEIIHLHVVLSHRDYRAYHVDSHRSYVGRSMTEEDDDSSWCSDSERQNPMVH